MEVIGVRYRGLGFVCYFDIARRERKRDWVVERNRFFEGSGRYFEFF